MRVRRVDPDDWRRLRALHLRALADAPGAFLETVADAQALPGSAWLARATPSSSRRVVVAEDDDGRWVAMGVGHRASPAVVDVGQVWTAPEARGRGVASAIVGAIVGWARARGAVECRLETEASNHTARRVYRRLGFVETGEPGSVVASDRVMRLSLDRPHPA